jgi:putative FmdB family regulatory protein
MPIYEYECSLCRCRFERRQRFDDEPVTVCPECEGKARRVIHSVPIIFKGSGFFTTDNRKGGEIGPVEEKKKSSGREKER